MAGEIDGFARSERPLAGCLWAVAVDGAGAAEPVVIVGTLIDATKAKELTDNRGTDCCRCGLNVLGGR